jgi:hypothetical protein
MPEMRFRSLIDTINEQGLTGRPMAEPEAAPSWSTPQNEDTLRTTIPGPEREPGSLPPFVPVLDVSLAQRGQDFEPVETQCGLGQSTILRVLLIAAA